MLAMARRTGLFGASDVEREARLTQQRDYAAQLQEQVRAKQAQAEQQRAWRRHEQQREREQADALATQPPLPAQQQQQPASLSPPRSPLRAQPPPQPSHQQLSQPVVRLDWETHHGSALLNGSPTKPVVSDTLSGLAVPSNITGPHAAGVATLSPLVAGFSAGPSIFDSLLHSESDRTLTHHIQSLQTLRAEIETMWKQRRTALQSVSSKPSFIVAPSPTASAGIPLSFEEKRQLDEEIAWSPRPETEEPELTSHTSGLHGESVLIPLVQTSPSKRSEASLGFTFSSPPRSNSAVYRRLAAASAAAATTDDATASKFGHESELVHFDP